MLFGLDDAFKPQVAMAGFQALVTTRQAAISFKQFAPIIRYVKAMLGQIRIVSTNHICYVFSRLPILYNETGFCEDSAFESKVDVDCFEVSVVTCQAAIAFSQLAPILH